MTIYIIFYNCMTKESQSLRKLPPNKIIYLHNLLQDNWERGPTQLFFKNAKQFIKICTSPQMFLISQHRILKRLFSQMRSSRINNTSKYEQYLLQIVTMIQTKIIQFQKQLHHDIFHKTKQSMNLLFKLFDNSSQPEINKSKFIDNQFNISSDHHHKYLIKHPKQELSISREPSKILEYVKRKSKNIVLPQRKGIQSQICSIIKSLSNGEQQVPCSNCLGCSNYFPDEWEFNTDQYCSAVHFQSFSQVGSNDQQQKNKQICQTIVGMMNDNGGLIFIGVKNNKIQGMIDNNDHINSYCSQIKQHLNKFLKYKNLNSINTQYYKIIKMKIKSNQSPKRVLIAIEVRSFKKQFAYLQYKVNQSDNNPQYVFPNKIDVARKSACCYGVDEDIYKNIVYKYYKKNYYQKHYGLHCLRSLQPEIQNCIYEQMQTKKAWEDRKLSQKYGEMPKNFPAMMFHSILIVKGNPNQEIQQTYKERIQEIKQIIIKKVTDKFTIEFYFTKIQQQSLNSRVYYIQHAKSINQISRILKKQLTYVKMYPISQTIIITSERQKITKHNIISLYDSMEQFAKENYETTQMRFGKVKVKVSQTQNMHIRNFIEITSGYKTLLFSLIKIRQQGFTSVFLDNKHQVTYIWQKQFSHDLDWNNLNL